jgi:glycosyltransferase involved in cell wall biosynthesis
MNILHLANHAQKIGNGIVNMMVDLACTQADAGHQVTVATAGGEFEALLARHRVAHVVLPQSPRLARLPSMLRGFRQVVAHSRPDVVHAHMMTGALIARLACWRPRYALVTTVHNEFQRSARLMGVGDRVVGVTRAVAASMARRGIPPHRLAVVRNGTIGTPRFDALTASASPRLQRPSIVTLAGVYRRKGIQDLLRAFARLCARHPGAALYVVGDGPDRAEMTALARELGIAPSTHFVGFVDDPRPYLAQADVFVLASHADPAPLVLCEAREQGCAIVATRVDGIPEMLDDGEAGLLVPPAEPPALAAAIDLLLTDVSAHAALVARARRGLDAFGVQQVCDSYMTIYRQTLADVAARRPRGEPAHDVHNSTPL